MTLEEFEAAVEAVRLSPAERARLLSRHLSGDFGGGHWSTIESLERKGMLIPGLYTLTEVAVAWCDAHHMDP